MASSDAARAVDRGRRRRSASTPAPRAGACDRGVLEDAHARPAARRRAARAASLPGAGPPRRCGPRRRRGRSGRRPRPASLAVEQLDVVAEARAAARPPRSSHGDLVGVGRARRSSPVASKSQSMPCRSRSARRPAKFSQAEPLEHLHLARRSARARCRSRGSATRRRTRRCARSPPKPARLGLEQHDVARRVVAPWRAARPRGR